MSSSSLETVLLQQLLVLLGVLVISATIFAEASEPSSSCETTCGLIDIPYPFGTSEGCYRDSTFLITCNSSMSGTNTSSIPFLGDSNIQVLNISLDGELRISVYVARDCPLQSDRNASDLSYDADLIVRDFPISYTKNVFTAVGCDTMGLIGSSPSDKNYTTGCVSFCDNMDGMVNGSCSGRGCCQTPIPDQIRDFTVQVTSLHSHSTVGDFNPCGFAFVVEKKEYNFSTLDLRNMQGRDEVPVVLDWIVGNETCEVAEKNLTGLYACKAANSECVTIQQTVMGIAATAPQAITETHISLMVVKILMSVKRKL